MNNNVNMMVTRALLNALVTLLIATTASASVALKRTSQNTAVLQGDSIAFNCSSNKAATLLWFNSTCNDYNSISCRGNILYNGYTIQQPASPRLNVTGDNISGQLTRDLHINPVSISDASVYVCVEDSGGGAITAADSSLLIVLASSTTCTTNITASNIVEEFDVIYIECSVAYNGNWTPVMRWQNDVTGQNLTSYVINTTSQLVTSRLTLTATASLNATRIICVTYFSDNPATRTVTVSATNIPTYTHKWNSSTIIVRRKYAPTNITIYPLKAEYSPSDTLHCWADGNPLPTYQWRDLMKTPVMSGPDLHVTSDMRGRNFTFQCTATNSFNGSTYSLATNITVVVQHLTTTAAESTTESLTSVRSSTNSAVPSTVSLMPSETSTLARSGSNTAIIAGVVCGVGGAAILVVLIVVIVVCRRKKRKGTDKPTKSKPKKPDDMQLVSGEQDRISDDSNRDNGITNDAADYARVTTPGPTNKPTYGGSPAGLYETVNNGERIKSIMPLDVNETPGAPTHVQPDNIAPPIVNNNTDVYAQVTTIKGPNAPPAPNPKPKTANPQTATYAFIDHTILPGNKK